MSKKASFEPITVTEKIFSKPLLLYECSKNELCHHDVGTYPSAVAADEFGASSYNYNENSN
jgi:hypothetical protein